ncbi:MAG: DUF374 domain-containing protein [Abditibacteriales bacterium]|nr:DUF374 domain-containing protein [Abditibacteriales bacterium]
MKFLSSLPQRLSGALCWALACIGIYVFLIVESTLDLRVRGMERLRQLKKQGKNALLVVWHGKGLLPVVYFQGESLCIYCSQVRQGEIATASRLLRQFTLAALRQLGYQVLDAARFGSESRGVVQLMRVLQQGTSAVIAADGPMGPIYQAKPGPCYLAHKTGVTLLPVSTAMSRGIALAGWDRFEIPQPFARGVIWVGEPMEVPANADDTVLEQMTKELEKRLNDLTRCAEADAHLKSGAARKPAPSPTR